MEVLVTSSRLPFALEQIRKLGRTGHRICASDTFESAPGSHSRYAARHFVTASPTYEPMRFLDELEAILRACRVDRLSPSFEEVFYIARHRSRFERHAELFAPSFEVLRRLHEKGAFLAWARTLGLRVPATITVSTRDELEQATREFPRYFARAAYSRAGVALYTNTGPLAGALRLEDVEPTKTNPFIVQEYLDGIDVCSFGIAHHGRLAAQVSYVHPLTIEHAGGIVIDSVDDLEVRTATRTVVEVTEYHGYISLDFRRTDGGLFVLECNPRPSAGLALLPDWMFDDAFTDRVPDRTRIGAPGIRRTLSLGVLRNMLVDWRGVPENVRALSSPAKDLYIDPDDLKPLVYQVAAYGRVIGYRLKTRRLRRSDIMQGYLHDICWDGEPIH